MLSFETRDIGRVTIIRCAGRIVIGDPSKSLRAHVIYLLRDRLALVLHLGEIGFIDSTGLGTIVRLLTATRQARGDLKLCAVPPPVQALLKITTTQRLFDIHDSEENAIAGFYRSAGPERPAPAEGPAILCVHKSADVLAYLREFLRNAGYEVHTTSAVRDALLLLRVAHPRLVVLGHDLGSHAERKTAKPPSSRRARTSHASPCPRIFQVCMPARPPRLFCSKSVPTFPTARPPLDPFSGA